MASKQSAAIAVEPNLDPSRYGQQPGSTYDVELTSYTTSVASDVTKYKIENDRRYHAYKEGTYLYPNDEKENDRLGVMHKLVEVSLKGKIHLAPISTSPRRILDLGTGTGVWALEMGDKYPNSEILGNDLSPIQPRWVPPNVRFEVDDVEAEWTYHHQFDLIHGRFLGGAIQDWPRLVRQCYEYTKPGGYTELTDLDLRWESPDGSLKEDHASRIFNIEYIQAFRSQRKEPCPGPLLGGLLKDAGFTDVRVQKLVLPVGTWPADPHLKHVGAWNYLQITEGLEAFTYAIFSRQLGYSQQEIDVICANIRREIKNPKMHALFHLYVAYGKKPEK